MLRSAFLLVWTLWTSFVAIVLHFLLLGLGDPGMRYARRVWWPVLRRVAGMRLELEGALPAGFHGPCVVVSNHQGYLDIPIVIGLLDLQLRFIFKRELFLIPFFGWYLFAAGFIGINRSDRKNSIRGLERAGERIRRRGTSIIVFAEGTRTHEGEVKPFKKGAFHIAVRAAVPLVPVAIEGSHRMMGRHTWRVTPGHVRVRIGEPVPTEGLTTDDVPRLAREFHDRIEGWVQELRARDAGRVAPEPGAGTGAARETA